MFNRKSHDGKPNETWRTPWKQYDTGLADTGTFMHDSPRNYNCNPQSMRRVSSVRVLLEHNEDVLIDC